MSVGLMKHGRPHPRSCFRILNKLTLNQHWPQRKHLSFSTLLSDENRDRCIKQLSQTKPVRQLAPWARGKDLKRAAVLVPLCVVDGKPSLLYTLRSSKLNNYRGQVSFPGGLYDETDGGDVDTALSVHVYPACVCSFPGGLYDETDGGDVDTALREAEEEVGLKAEAVEVWGCMNPVPGKDYKTAVTPVVANCGEIRPDQLQHSIHEVEEVFSRSIRSLCHRDNTRYTTYTHGYTLPVYLGGDHRIWGLTAIITHQLLSVIAPQLYTNTITQPTARKGLYRLHTHLCSLVKDKLLHL